MAPHKNHVSHDKYIDREEECEKSASDIVEQVNVKKESKLKDVIEAALDDAFLLEKMASYENPFSHDKYMDRAEECEKFAIDIVEQVNGNKDLLYNVMDIDGEGALVKKESNDFIRSLSLLKMAANIERKLVSGRLISVINTLFEFTFPTQLIVPNDLVNKSSRLRLKVKLIFLRL